MDMNRISVEHFPVSEIRENPQVVARSYYHCIAYSHAGTRRSPRLPVQFSFGELAEGPAPSLGQHNEEILGALGVDAERLDELRSRGVVGVGLEA